MVERLVRFAAQLLYSSFAWSYDAVAWLVSMGQWSAWTATGLEALPEGFALEIGHGPGHMLEHRLRTGQPTVGLDLSRQMSRIARRRLRRAGLRLDLVRAKTQHLPFAAGWFDGVLSTFPSEYILDPQTLAEVGRVLKAGGMFVVVPMARVSGHSLLDRAAAWFAHRTGEDRLPPPSLAEAFAPHGMSVESEWVQLPRGQVLRLIGRRLGSSPSKETT